MGSLSPSSLLQGQPLRMKGVVSQFLLSWSTEESLPLSLAPTFSLTNMLL